MNAQKELIERLQGLGSKAQFVSFDYTAKGTGEQARHTIILGASYTKQIEESLLALQLLAPTLVGPVETQAFNELQDSFNETLAKMAVGEYNSAYTKADAYITISNGLKYCLSTGCINVSGLSHAKVVKVPGVYKEVKSRPLTIAKNNIKLRLPVARWREFVIAPENLQAARLQGVELILG